jgi:hypothetical protein
MWGPGNPAVKVVIGEAPGGPDDFETYYITRNVDDIFELI